jgi:hypothetical protein
MTKAISIGALPVPEGGHEFTVQIREPGLVHSVAWVLEPKLVLERGQPNFNEVLTLFIETAPEAPLRNRRFVVLETGQKMTVKDGHALKFIGTAASGNTARVAHVFEVKAQE